MNQIDVVYKLGIGSTCQDNELRFSLRSLSNFTPLRNVYIVGHKPSWIKDVIHIPAPDFYLSCKDSNLIIKMILASLHPSISDEFVNMSDDQFFMHQCGYDEIKVPYIYNAHLPENAKPGTRIGRWQLRLGRTVAELKKRGLPGDCFESHMPCLLNRHKYMTILSQYDFYIGKGYCGNTLYYNTMGIKGRELTPETLARLITPITDPGALETFCAGKQFLNYTDGCLNENLLLYLQRNFPGKSKYEI